MYMSKLHFNTPGKETAAGICKYLIICKSILIMGEKNACRLLVGKPDGKTKT
jgi:hypothetical protein